MREFVKFISKNGELADKYILFLKIGNNGIGKKIFYKILITTFVVRIHNFILNKNDLNLGKLKN